MDYYYEILAFHIIAVMSWMTLVFYMPRLFVYHVENMDKKDFVSVVKIQEEKIYKVIGFPAMMASIISGTLMLWLNPDLLKNAWMHAKLFAILCMIVYTLSLNYYRKQLLQEKCRKTGKYFRAYNEVPTLIAIYVVVFVVTKGIPVYFTIAITVFFAFIIYKILTKKV
jgi:putative membrane protein